MRIPSTSLDVGLRFSKDSMSFGCLHFMILLICLFSTIITILPLVLQLHESKLMTLIFGSLLYGWLICSLTADPQYCILLLSS